MPDTFTVFPAANRQPNTEYNSGTYTVPVDSVDKMVQFTLTNLDIINEPTTTVIHWMIEHNDGSGWRHLAGYSLRGLNGVVELPDKNHGSLSVTIHDLRGHDVRGTLSFETAGDKRLRFGVGGATF